MSDWKEPATLDEWEADKATEAEWEAAPVKQEEKAPTGPGGFVKMADPSTKEGRIEAQVADLNTKRGKEESDSNARIGLLKRILAASQTGSLNLGDEMAGVKSAIQGKGYRAGQQSAEREAKAAQDEYPLASLAGVAPMMLVPGAQGVGSRLLAAGFTGGAASLGDSPGMASAQDKGAEGLKGAGISALVQGGFEVASPVLGKLAGYLKNQQAPEWALKGAGMRGGIRNRAQALGFENVDEAQKFGRELLDQGLIPPGGDKVAVAGRSEALRQQSANTIGQALQKGEMSGIPADYDEAAWAAIKPAMEGTVLARQNSATPIRKLLKAMAGQADETPGSWEMLNRTKSELGRNINWAAQPKGAAPLARQTYGALEENLAGQLNKAAPGAGDMLREGNKGYSTAKTALALADDQGLREAANQGLSLKDVALGFSGASAGGSSGALPDSLTAAAVAALSKLIRERGPSLGARAADDIAAPLLQGASGINQLPAAVGAGQSLTPEEQQRRRLLRLLAGD